MSNRSTRHPSLALRVALALCGTGLALAAVHAAETTGQTVTVAMRYVEPPFKGGSKVRTPEDIDGVLASQLAARLNRTLRAEPLASAKAAHPRIALVGLPGNLESTGDDVIVFTGYVSRPMAIMRTDTDITSWSQLKGRSVCVSEGGAYVGRIAAEYGAIEKVFPAPADSLLALRTGGCDAAVHDDVMLKELLKLPEWKKFSANLTSDEASRLAFVLPADAAEPVAAARELAKAWKTNAYLSTLNTQRVRDIAFEVYLDQTVPDCH